MSFSEPYFKTQQVAQRLGVSVSTIKRWVDSGMIRAVRTVGKHRLIPMSEALRMAREQGVPWDFDEGAAEIGTMQLLVVDDGLRDGLTRFLRDGQTRQAKRLIHSVYLAGCGAVTLADQLIRPVMERIGHGWMIGALDVHHEHQASHIAATAILELIDRVARAQESPGPLALGATPEGDPYILSGLLGELVLRELGWDVRNLGVNLPLRSLANATLQYRPKLVFLSINYLRDETHFLKEYLSFYEFATATDAAVMIGGQALDQELRAKLVFSGFGDRLAHLAEFARQLAPRSVLRSALAGGESSNHACNPLKSTRTLGP